MALNAALQALAVPSGTEFPGTVQAQLNLIAEYIQIIGLDTFNGINYGPVTPDEDSRGLPWFQTDNAYNPIGWNSWNGSAWKPIPMTLPTGVTASYPNPATAGQMFFDTTLNIAVIYERSQWRTLAGSPGDTKEVRAVDLPTALAQNPGWVQDTASNGMVIAGAMSAGTGQEYGATAGADSVTLVHDQLPVFSLPFLSGVAPFPSGNQNGAQDPGQFPIYTGQSSTSATANFVYNAPLVGQLPIDNRQATTYLWRLLKQ